MQRKHGHQLHFCCYSGSNSKELYEIKLNHPLVHMANLLSSRMFSNLATGVHKVHHKSLRIHSYLAKLPKIVPCCTEFRACPANTWKHWDGKVNKSSCSWPNFSSKFSTTSIFHKHSSIFSFCVCSSIVYLNSSINNRNIVIVIGNLLHLIKGKLFSIDGEIFIVKHIVNI